MKKRFSLFLLIGVMSLVLTGCCDHSYIDATCVAPKTCVECGKTEGTTVDHTWQEATCATPKICSVCNATEGEALEHAWEEATCTEAKTCSICGATEGEALAHTLTEATYLQGATCEVCGTVEGEPLQPQGTEEDIATLQAKMDAFVETYNTGNQKAIDIMAEYVAKSGRERLDAEDEYIQTMNGLYGVDYDWLWWYSAIPMNFFLNVNQDMIGQLPFDDFIVNVAYVSIDEFANFVQEEANVIATDGILFFNTMEYAKEIATGNPIALDVIYYDEPQKVDGMIVKSVGYGMINVNGKLFRAQLSNGCDIINIYPEDEKVAVEKNVAEKTETIKADFEEKNIPCEAIAISDGYNMIGKTFEYVAMCSEDNSKTTKGQVLLIDSEKVASDEKHPAKDGYEWTTVNLTLRYEDENLEYGVNPGIRFEDYYDIAGLDGSAVDLDDEHDWHFTYTVNWEGKEYTGCELIMDYPYFANEDVMEIYVTASICCPIGYDGSVMGFYNEQVGSISDDSDAVFIRLK